MNKEEFLTIVDKEIDRLNKEIVETENLIAFYENMKDPRLEREKRKLYVLRQQVKKLVEIINLPLLLRIKNMTSEEVEKYRYLKMRTYDSFISYYGQRASDLQKQLDSLNAQREALLARIRNGENIESISQEYIEVDEQIKKLLEEIEKVLKEKSIVESEKRVLESKKVEDIKRDLISKISTIENMRFVESKTRVSESEEIIGELHNPDAVVDFASATSAYTSSKATFERAKQEYIAKEGQYDNPYLSLLGLPDKLLEYFSLPYGFEFYVSKHEDTSKLEKLDEAKKEFDYCKQRIAEYTNILLSDNNFPEFAGLENININKIEKLLKVNTIYGFYLGTFIRKKADNIKNLFNIVESLNKKLIKTKRIKEQIASNTKALIGATKEFYDIAKQQIFLVIEKDLEYCCKYGTLQTFSREAMKKSIAEINVKISETEASFNKIYEQVGAIKERRNKAVQSELYDFERKRQAVSDVVGRDVKTTELGFGHEGMFSNYTSDADENVQKITPAYAKFKQSEMVRIVEDEAAKDGSVDPKDIESIIEHRNAVAKQAENNSGMSL